MCDQVRGSSCTPSGLKLLFNYVPSAMTFIWKFVEPLLGWGSLEKFAVKEINLLPVGRTWIDVGFESS